jgi:hypothetical protein
MLHLNLVNLYLQIILLTSIVFFLFTIWRRWNPWVLIIIISVSFAATYYFIATSSATMFWGLIGDETFIASLFEHQAYGRLFGDLNYLHLPLFYPPLYFIVGGIVGKLFNLGNGIIIAKAMTMIVLAAAPIIFFALIKWQKRIVMPWQYAVLAVYLLIAVHDFDAIILKPYELISGGVAVLAAGSFFSDLIAKQLTKKKLIIYAILFALVFATFYFWTILIAIAGILFLIFERQRKSLLINGLIIAASTLVLSSWYLVPNILSFIRTGYENWQPLHFVSSDFDIFFPYFHDLTLISIISGLGIISFAIYVKKDGYIRSLFYLFLAGYIYQLLNYVLQLSGGKPMQASKPFLFFTVPTLVLASIPLIKEIAEKYILKHKFAIPFLASIIFALGLYSPAGFFIRDKVVQAQLLTNQKYQLKEISLYNALKSIPELNKKMFLTSGFNELEARLPYYNFIAHNIHLSHPAASFSKRYDYINDLAKSKDSQEFLNKLKSNSFDKIDGLILFGDQENYYLYFWLDNYPNGGREEVIKIPHRLINSVDYNIVYQNNDYSVLFIK